MRIVGFCLVSLAALVVLEPTPAGAEVVVLKNGSRISGKVTDEREMRGQVVVQIGAEGHVTLRARDVQAIIPDAPTEPAKVEEGQPKPGDFVEVRTPADQRGPGKYYGALSAETTQKEIVLEVAGAGKIRIARTAGVAVAKTDVTIMGVNRPAPAEAGAIRTTHVIILKNGRKLSGNLVATPDTEPVRLAIGTLGELTIPRDKIAAGGIQAVEGSIQLPAAEPTKPVEKPEIPDAVREELKRELKKEILRELLDQLIDEKLGRAVEGLRAAIPEEHAGAPSGEEVAEIQGLVQDLTRNRNIYRTRAERKLKDLGSVVLPYLEAVADHPFWLTRRAVQRVIRDVGSLSGAPLAIAHLNDEDEFVRQDAWEALRSILPTDVRYSADERETGRLEAQAKLWSVWEETVRGLIRDKILARLADA